MREVFYGFFSALYEFLLRPWVVLWVCVLVGSINLVFDGTLLRMWGLRRDLELLQENSHTLTQQLKKTKEQIRQASDLVFVEREARDRFDLVKEQDLVFVFSDDE